MLLIESKSAHLHLGKKILISTKVFLASDSSLKTENLRFGEIKDQARRGYKSFQKNRKSPLWRNQRLSFWFLLELLKSGKSSHWQKKIYSNFWIKKRHRCTRAICAVVDGLVFWLSQFRSAKGAEVYSDCYWLRVPVCGVVVVERGWRTNNLVAVLLVNSDFGGLLCELRSTMMPYRFAG